MEKITSKNGFAINICCASCTHKLIVGKSDREPARKCALTGESVTARMFCDRHTCRKDLLKL